METPDDSAFFLGAAFFAWDFLTGSAFLATDFLFFGEGLGMRKLRLKMLWRRSIPKMQYQINSLITLLSGTF
jgi:hypothetical protein